MRVRFLGTFLMAALLVALGLFALAASTQAAEAKPAQADAATLAIAHFAPFTTTVPATSVTVTVNGSDAITDLVFGDVVQGVTLTAGTYEFGVVPTGSVTAALTFTASLTDGQDLLVAAIGGANGWQMEPFVLVNDRTPFTDGAKVRISHLSPFSTTLAGTSIDVCTEDNTKLVEDLQYKETAGLPADNGYVKLPPGIYDLKIAVNGTNCATVAFDVPPVALRTGMVVDIAAIGLPGGSPAFDLWTDGITARARVGHFAPFTDPISTSVTILVDGQPLVTDIKFPQLTEYHAIAPGTYLVQVVPTGSMTATISETVNVTGLVDYTLAAIGDDANQPLDLVALVDDNATPPSAGNARVRVSHFAPDFIVGAGGIGYVFAVGDGTNAAPTVVAAPDFSVKVDWLFPMIFNQLEE